RLFRSRRYPAPVAQVAVAFLEMLVGRNVTRGALAISQREDERIGPLLLGEQLILDVGLARQQKHLRGAEVEDGHVELVAGVGALAPAQAERSETLAERLCVGRQAFCQVG